MAAAKVDRSKLLATLRDAAAPLADVDEKKMFGCEALFRNGAIFALVWKTGRIGVKLPDAARFEALASQKGTEPWRAGPMVMSHWLLVPPSIDRDAKKLAPWVKEAHAMAGPVVKTAKPKKTATPKAKPKPKTKPKTKAGAKKRARG